MSDQCLQYKQDYEKLLALKQEFDAALTAGGVKRDLTETKGMKTELEKAIIYLERDLKFKVRMTVELGTGLKTADDFIREFMENKYGIMSHAESMMRNPEFTVSSEKIELELIMVSIAELGFSEDATIEEVYKRAKEMGLELCPPEVGPQLRLQYRDQPKGKAFTIAMNPIEDSVGGSRVFRIDRDTRDNAWLGALYCEISSNVWGADRQWIFVRRKLT